MNEPEQRLAIGGHFNHAFMWATLKAQGETSSPEPTGAVSSLHQDDMTAFGRNHQDLHDGGKPDRKSAPDRGGEVAAWVDLAVHQRQREDPANRDDQQRRQPTDVRYLDCAVPSDPRHRPLGARVLRPAQRRQGGLHQSLLRECQLGQGLLPFREARFNRLSEPAKSIRNYLIAKLMVS